MNKAHQKIQQAIKAEKPLDETGEGVILCQTQQEMVVVGHPAVGNDGYSIVWQKGLGAVQEELVIAVVGKYAFAVTSSVVDVVTLAC